MRDWFYAPPLPKSPVENPAHQMYNNVACNQSEGLAARRKGIESMSLTPFPYYKLAACVSSQAFDQRTGFLSVSNYLSFIKCKVFLKIISV